MEITVIALMVFILILIGLLSLLIKCYVKCPPDKILVRTGIGGIQHRTQSDDPLRGGMMVLPSLHDKCFLPLEPIRIELESRHAVAFEENNVFTIAISDKPEILENAITRLSGLNIDEIKIHASDLILSVGKNVDASNADESPPLSVIQRIEEKLNTIGLTIIAHHG